MLEVRVAAEGLVEVLHAEGEVLGECVDGGVVYRGEAVDVCVGGGIGGVGGVEGLGEVGEDGGEAVVLIQAREGPGCKLYMNVSRRFMYASMVSERTSNASSNRLVNSATTKLICSLCGTYAFPLFMNTLLCSTRSGTRSQSTLHHSCSSPFLDPPAAINCSLNSLFSSSPTSSQSNFNEFTNALRSRISSSLNRSLKSIVSSRENRRRRSSVEENASRSIKCE